MMSMPPCSNAAVVAVESALVVVDIARAAAPSHHEAHRRVHVDRDGPEHDQPVRTFPEHSWRVETLRSSKSMIFGDFERFGNVL